MSAWQVSLPSRPAISQPETEDETLILVPDLALNRQHAREKIVSVVGFRLTFLSRSRHLPEEPHQ